MAISTGELKAWRWLHGLHPDEQHGIDSDCINPFCDYNFTDADKTEIIRNDGWFECPKCGTIYDYLKDPIPGQGGYTRSGLTMTAMGTIGEQVVERLGTIPGLGPITWVSPDYNSPIDMIAGDYGVEVKTIHSQSQPRFKISGEKKSLGGQIFNQRQWKYHYVQEQGLKPALVGVRLNFYRSLADVFVRPDGFPDAWISAGALTHIGTFSFEDLNPYANSKVPDPSQLPEDDSTPAPDSDIPW